MKIVIIGAGASGIIAALKIDKENEVIIVEANDKIGKKILVTGNGKCNFWHENISVENYNTDAPEKLTSIIKSQDEVFNFLTDDLGIYPFNKNGYYYPNSGLASSIQNVLINALNKPNIDILYNQEVVGIDYHENSIDVVLKNKEIIRTDKVIIATGGKAAPKTGSTGAGYDILKKIGVDVNPVYPALVPLKLSGDYLKEWQGIRMPASITVKDNDKTIAYENGEIQLTDYGISGIVTFNISSKVVKLLSVNKEPCVSIDFLPSDDFRKIFTNPHNLNKSLGDILETVINYKLIPVILKRANLSRKQTLGQLTDEDKINLVRNVKDFKIKITETCDFEKAQVSTGGVSLNLVDEHFALKQYPNLYVIGEMLDVDGLCGGYNLAFAFMSGYICGSFINDKN